MQSILVWLLKNRVTLGRLAVLTTIIPFYLASISILTIPMTLALGVLLFTLNWKRIKRMFSNFIHAHFWLKIQYFWFTTAFIVVTMLIYANLGVIIVPAHYFIGLGYLSLYFIWFNKMNSLMTQEHRRIILKNETMEKSSSLDFEPYLVPLSYTLVIVFTIASIQSMFLSRGARIFDIRSFYWYFVIVILFLHFIVDMIFVEQIEWDPKDGSVEWNPDLINTRSLTNLPDVTNPTQLAAYFDITSKIPRPPTGLDKYIENNLQFLVKNAQDINYFPFQINYIRSVENWGREGRDHIHLAFAIILASVSQYRFIGLIPLYRRKIFYQTLQTVAMTGSMTTRWRELIQFEVIGKKDEHFVLDWVLGSRYLEMKYDPDWLITWEGKIYKGKIGYYEAVRKMDQLIQIRPEMNDWQIDIWNLCFEYSHVFVGENARKLLSENMQYYDKLLYLADKRTSEEYEQAKEEYKQKLLNPEDRLVFVPEEKQVEKMSSGQKREIINNYLGSEPQDYEEITLKQSILGIKDTMAEIISGLDIKVFAKLIGFVIVYLINISIIILLDRYLENNLGLFIIVIEIILLFIFSISPSDGNLNLQDEQSTQSAVLQTSTFNQAAIRVNSADISTSMIFLIYGISLLFVYQYFFL